MTHMHIPTIPTPRDRRSRGSRRPSHRRTLPTVIDPRVASGEEDLTGPYDVTDSPGRHRAPAHRRDCAPDWVNVARCTGGLVNDYGVRLMICRSVKCPSHKPDNYADAYARHATDSL